MVSEPRSKIVQIVEGIEIREAPTTDERRGMNKRAVSGFQLALDPGTFPFLLLSVIPLRS